MNDTKKPDVATNESSGFINTSAFNYSKASTKRETVLMWLINKSEKGLRVTRFDAEKIGDHCLNTTVSELGQIDGIKISRRMTKRPTRFGKKVDCNEYWIAKPELHKARQALAIKQSRRSA